MGVNSLPKTVTRQRRDCDLNPGPSAPESSTLTTRLPSHPLSRYCIEATRRIELVLACQLPFTYPKLQNYKEIWISPKVSLLSSGILPQTQT